MNLDRVEQLLSRLPIRHRDRSGVKVPFVFNFNQHKSWAKYKQHLSKGLPLRVICVKSRRVGFSKQSDGLLFAHCLAMPNAHALIAAHDFTTSVDLFKDPLDWVKAVPLDFPKPTQHRIVFQNPQGDSELLIATAGNVEGGHGLTRSALHLSEAARYQSAASFTGLLSTVSDNDPYSIIIIESTANGREGDGELFYEYWRAACHGDNGYLPVFLGWLEDHDCVRDPEEAVDAPRDDVERELMGPPFHATLAQVAWYRYILEAKCHGFQDTFCEQYPWTPDVAFLTTGDPAFSRAELSYMRSTLADPIAVGHIEADNQDRTHFEPASGGWRIYEHPDGVSWYYLGGDAARGVEWGDFASMVIWNGHTGALAAAYDEKVDPEVLAKLANAAGRYYGTSTHAAMINVELTGNLGWWVQKLLATVYYYPNIYLWRGRDDRIGPRRQTTVAGWETTYKTREMMFVAFRAALVHKHLQPKDKIFIQQAESAQRGTRGRFVVEKGHDDVFLAGLLGWIAREQYPPPPRDLGSHKPFTEDNQQSIRALRYTEDITYAGTILANHHLGKIERARIKKTREERIGEML